MSNPVKTSGDWMSLFLGSRPTSARDSGSVYRSSSYATSGYARDARLSPPADYSRAGSRLSRHTDTSASMSAYEEYSGSRYSRHAITSPPTYRRSQANAVYSSRYRHLAPSGDDDAEDGDEADRNSGNRAEKNSYCPRTQSNVTQSATQLGPSKSKSKSSVTVLNEGVIVIKRPAGPATTSDEESDEETTARAEEVPPTPSSPSPPPRDPLEVEEEQLTNKLQTAGFLMSLPEEEHARKRLVEIRQMRENPDMFRPENSRDWKFSLVSSDIPPPSAARAEEEKILLLRLGSRGIKEVEQTDVQVRLQEIWRDRREEVDRGVSRLEQEYEHLLSESSTEIYELEGSIRGKQNTISKLQEEILILTLKKEKVAKDMDKVTTAHHLRLEELNAEIAALEKRSSEFSVVKRKSDRDGECSLPEDERSEIESELECPVCFEISRPPIYQCGEGHIICSACKPLLKTCCQCESRFSDPPIRCRFAEKLAAKYFKGED